MKSAGVFFLRGRPVSARVCELVDDRGIWVLGWIFPLGERTTQPKKRSIPPGESTTPNNKRERPPGVRGFIGIWSGQEADRFVAANPNLVAGDCLRLELDRLHVSNNELHAIITKCEMAPPRWPEPSHTEGTESASGAFSRALSERTASHSH